MLDPGLDLTEIDWLPRLSVGSLTEQQATSSQHFAAKALIHQSCSSVVPSNSPTAGKPPFSYGELIKMAIGSTNDMQMTLSEIYRWVSNNFDYYKHCQSPSWKNSIRHNLSLSKHFLKVPRGPDDPGKGCYWTVDTHLISTSSYKTRGKFPRKSKKKRKTLVVSPYKPEGSIVFPLCMISNLPAEPHSYIDSVCLENLPVCREEFQCTSLAAETVYEDVNEPFEDGSLLRSVMESAGIPFQQNDEMNFISQIEYAGPQCNNCVQTLGFNGDQIEPDFDWDSLFDPILFQ